MIAILRIDLLYSGARDAEMQRRQMLPFLLGGGGRGGEDIMVLIIPPVIQSCTLKQHERRGAAGPRHRIPVARTSYRSAQELLQDVIPSLHIAFV